MQRGMQLGLVVVSLFGLVASATAGTGNTALQKYSGVGSVKKSVVPQASLQKFAQANGNPGSPKKRVVPQTSLQKFTQTNGSLGSPKKRVIPQATLQKYVQGNSPLGGPKKSVLPQSGFPQWIQNGQKVNKQLGSKPLNLVRGDGRIVVNPTPAASTPGQIQLGDRWDRAKSLQHGAGTGSQQAGSKQKLVDGTRVSIDSFPVSNLGGNNAAGTIVFPAGKPQEVRDHRAGAPQGGVTVTNTPGGGFRGDVVGSGGSPIDTVIETLVEIFPLGTDFTPGQVPLDLPRDHRTQTYGGGPPRGRGEWQK